MPRSHDDVLPATSHTKGSSQATCTPIQALTPGVCEPSLLHAPPAQLAQRAARARFGALTVQAKGQPLCAALAGPAGPAAGLVDASQLAEQPATKEPRPGCLATQRGSRFMV